MIINKGSIKYFLIIIVAVFLFSFSYPKFIHAQSCSPSSGYDHAQCMKPESGKNGKTIEQQIKELCDPDSTPKINCSWDNSKCPGQACCMWTCEKKPELPQDDCMGFCIQAELCAQTTSALSNPSKEGSCADSKKVCCGQQIVTPEGNDPTATTTDSKSGSGSSAKDKKPVDTQVGSACREPTTGLHFPCIDEGHPQTVVTSVVARLVNWILTMSGVIFLVMFVWGGISFMIAGGDSSKADKARKVLVNSFIGVVIILGSYVILDWIFTALITAIK